MSNFYRHVQFDRILIILLRWDCVSTFSVLLTYCVWKDARVYGSSKWKNRWIICGIQFSKAKQLLCEQTNNNVLTLGKICKHFRFICKQNSVCRMMNCCDTNVQGWIDETRWRTWLSSDETELDTCTSTHTPLACTAIEFGIVSCDSGWRIWI